MKNCLIGSDKGVSGGCLDHSNEVSFLLRPTHCPLHHPQHIRFMTSFTLQI